MQTVFLAGAQWFLREFSPSDPLHRTPAHQPGVPRHDAQRAVPVQDKDITQPLLQFFQGRPDLGLRWRQVPQKPFV